MKTFLVGALSDDLLAERVELARVVDADVELAGVVVELELEVGRRGGGDGGGGRRLLRPLLGHVAGIDSVYVGVVFACRARFL